MYFIVFKFNSFPAKAFYKVRLLPKYVILKSTSQSLDMKVLYEKKNKKRNKFLPGRTESTSTPPIGTHTGLPGRINGPSRHEYGSIRLAHSVSVSDSSSERAGSGTIPAFRNNCDQPDADKQQPTNSFSVMRSLSWAAAGGGWSAAGTEESSGGLKRPDNPKVKRQQTIDEDYDC